jgi:hypothetical protein
MLSMRPAIPIALVTTIVTAAVGGCGGSRTPSPPPPSVSASPLAAPPAPAPSPAPMPAAVPGWTPGSTSRELIAVHQLPCLDNGKRLTLAPGDDDPARCPLAVDASAGDYGVFDAPAGVEAEAALGAELGARAPELAACYLASYGADDAVPWTVVPVVLRLDVAAAPAAAVQIDATPGSDAERRFLTCVQAHVERWVLHPEAPPVRVALSFILDPFRGQRGRPVKLSTP